MFKHSEKHTTGAVVPRGGNLFLNNSFEKNVFKNYKRNHFTIKTTTLHSSGFSKNHQLIRGASDQRSRDRDQSSCSSIVPRLDSKWMPKSETWSQTHQTLQRRQVATTCTNIWEPEVKYGPSEARVWCFKHGIAVLTFPYVRSMWSNWYHHDLNLVLVSAFKVGQRSGRDLEAIQQAVISKVPPSVTSHDHRGDLGWLSVKSSLVSHRLIIERV